MKMSDITVVNENAVIVPIARPTMEYSAIKQNVDDVVDSEPSDESAPTDIKIVAIDDAIFETQGDDLLASFGNSDAIQIPITDDNIFEQLQDNLIEQRLLEDLLAKLEAPEAYESTGIMLTDQGYYAPSNAILGSYQLNFQGNPQPWWPSANAENTLFEFNLSKPSL